ncbi:hypothetical protein IRJ41_005141 [Triplophysa rosa]|uniref:Uncharacterized protein n=1 Tax=Triplophysa rosa TaxID=992332 RepID=A0A9W7TKF3_TRIRA|nr:hypothetical protein IRJ41_005141 [Triplophysa rosa]
MALSLNTGRPVAEGIPKGSSSEPVTPKDTSAYIIRKRPTYLDSDGNVCLVTTEPQAVVRDEETLSDTERPTESMAEQEEGPSDSDTQINSGHLASTFVILCAASYMIFTVTNKDIIQ